MSCHGNAILEFGRGIQTELTGLTEFKNAGAVVPFL
jgi:hypothetical protein